jgi:hypothetical protein
MQRTRAVVQEREHSKAAGSLDPIALTLAIWLGLVAGVGGLVRLSEDAAFQVALAEAAGDNKATAPVATAPVEAAFPFSPRLLAFGG